MLPKIEKAFGGLERKPVPTVDIQYPPQPSERRGFETSDLLAKQ